MFQPYIPYRPNYGFTLIELSIVLVIIGLMVGAIVGGRALVHQARLQNITKDFMMYQTAWNTYASQYDAMPGDHATATDYWGGRTNNGNGDGMIWSHAATNGQAQDEIVKAWQHLALAELIALTPFTSYWPMVRNVNVPRGPLDKSGYRMESVPYNTTSGTATFYGVQGTWNYFAAESTVNDFYDSILRPADARNIDLKIDDGNPTTGKLFGEEGGNPSGTCITSTAYTLSNTGIACTLAYRLK